MLRAAILTLICALGLAGSTLSGIVSDPQSKAVGGGSIQRLLPDGTLVTETKTSEAGEFLLPEVRAGNYRFSVSAPGFTVLTGEVTVPDSRPARADVQFTAFEVQSQSIVITAKPSSPRLIFGIPKYSTGRYSHGRSSLAAVERRHQRRAA